MSPKKPNGRKYTLTWAGLGIGCVLSGLTFVLALIGRLAPEWTQFITIAYPAMVALITGFNATNAFTTGKAIDKGLTP